MRHSPPSIALLLALCACAGGGKNTPPGAPTVAITPGAPTTVDALTAVIQGDAADPDGDPVTYAYAWFVDGAPTGEAGVTVDPAATTRGEVWKVVVTPSDADAPGTVGEAEVAIVDAAPTAALSLDPLSPRSGDAVTATAVTDDADEDAVTIAWSWSRDGVDVGLLDATLPAGTARRGEAWTVTGTPDDGELTGAPATAGFTVANAVPVVGAVLLTPATATAPDALTATLSGVGDADGDAVTVSVAWYADGALLAEEDVDGDGTSMLTGAFLKHQEVWASAVPHDGLEEGAEVESEHLVIDDAPPSATDARVAPDPVYADSVVTCVGEGWSDADGDAEGWQATWTVDGVAVSTEAVLPAGSYRRGSVVGCALVPDDGERTGEAVSSALVTVADAPPRCGSAAVTIGPDPATAGDALSVIRDGYADCADADGDALTRIWSWTADGVEVGTAETLAAGVARRGQTVVLEVAWTDGITVGAVATSNALVLGDALPVIGSLTLTPSPVYADSVVTAAAAATDADGDAVTLTSAWTVDGIVAGSGDSLSGAFVRGQTVVLTVTPSDGYATGAPASASAVVEDSPPGAPTVSVRPSSPGDDDALTCTIAAAAADADADTLAYTFAWTVGGAPYGAATTTTFLGDTIPASATSLSQEWTCSVTASDGLAAGEAGSATVTVGCDLDEDGHDDTACGGDDCDDGDPSLHPGAAEVCDGAGVDEDCDGLVDDSDPSLTGATYYRDADNDSFGDAASPLAACSRPTGYVSNPDDCDDTSNQVRPGGTERCDAAERDEDCDGLADDADATAAGKTSFYEDADADGYGGATTVTACDAPGGYVRTSGDCDDATAAANPGAAEVCDDGLDNDCDGRSYPCGMIGYGTPGDARAYLEAPSTGGFGYQVATGDFNGDAQADLAVAAYAANAAYVFYGPVVGALSPADAEVVYTGGAYLGYHLSSLGDIDGDGDDELFVADAQSTALGFLVEGGTLASGTLGVPEAWRSYPRELNAEGIGDFDGDGVGDFAYAAMAQVTTTPDSLTVFLGDPSGVYGSATWTDSTGNIGRLLAGGDDVDGDGLDDFVASAETVSSSSRAATYVFLGDAHPSGTSLYAPSDAWVLDTTEYGFAYPCLPGDVNDDGYADVGVANGALTWGVILGPPTSGRTVAADAYMTAYGFHNCTHGDVDDDGADELFLETTDGVSTYSLPLTSGSLSSPEGTLDAYHTTSDIAAPADLDGDGYLDVAFGDWDSSFGSVYVFGGGRW